MSLFWDPRLRRPQIWVYPFFIVITLSIAGLIYHYGYSKGSDKDIKTMNTVEEFK